MAYFHFRGDDEKRLKTLADNDDRTLISMLKRLVSLAYRELPDSVKDGK